MKLCENEGFPQLLPFRFKFGWEKEGIFLALSKTTRSEIQTLCDLFLQKFVVAVTPHLLSVHLFSVLSCKPLQSLEVVHMAVLGFGMTREPHRKAKMCLHCNNKFMIIIIIAWNGKSSTGEAAWWKTGCA